MRNLVNYSIFLILIVFLFVFLGCQRVHTESTGGPKASINPQYDAELINTDPNLPGDRFSKRVE